MNRLLAAIIAVTAWFAVITQLDLALENRTQPIGEALFRFFTFFTILTNLLVAYTFSRITFNTDSIGGNRLTMTTVYIAIVGLVYQVALRHIWDPQGMQRVVDELLHTVVPLLVLLFWVLQLKQLIVTWKVLSVGVIYPLVYLCIVIIRGLTTGYYPYPFLDAETLGWGSVCINILVLILVFIGFLAGATAIGRKFGKKELENQH